MSYSHSEYLPSAEHSGCPTLIVAFVRLPVAVIDVSREDVLRAQAGAQDTEFPCDHGVNSASFVAHPWLALG